MMDAITFVVAVNSEDVFRDNFLASPCLSAMKGCEILAQRGFQSAAAAYNEAIDRASNDLVIFVHQDIVLPRGWLLDLSTAMSALEETDPNWGVLGCGGMTTEGRFEGSCYTSGQGVLKGTSHQPVQIQTLDEIVLILRKSSGLRFDEGLSNFHMYGADICLRATEMGMKNYAIAAYCIHNTEQRLVLPDEFYECCSYVRRKWSKYLPIETTCIRLTRSNMPVYIRKLQEYRLRYIQRKQVGERRMPSGDRLMRLADGD